MMDFRRRPLVRASVALLALAWCVRTGAIVAQPAVPDAEDVAAVRAAAAQITGGDFDCPADRSTLRDRVCLVYDDEATDESRAGGIAVVGVGAFGPDGPEGGYALVLGRTVDGGWGYWHGTQQALRLLRLPGAARACAGADGLNIRAEPSTAAQVIGMLADEALVQADRYLLTEPGEPPVYDPATATWSQGRLGDGWYHITAPMTGWVYGRYLVRDLSDAERQSPNALPMLCQAAVPR